MIAVAALLAALAVVLCGDVPVNVSCDGGYFAGDVTVHLKHKVYGKNDAPADKVTYFEKDHKDQSSTTFDATNLCIRGWGEDNDDEKFCRSCSTDTRKNIEVEVIIPVRDKRNTAEDPHDYEIPDQGLVITVTNVNNLTIVKENLSDQVKNKDETYLDADNRTKEWDVVKSVEIKYVADYKNTGNAGATDEYCPVDGSVYLTYPAKDCYKFDQLSIEGVVLNGTAGNTISSLRRIPKLTMKTVKVYGTAKVDIKLFPGLYQGPGNPSLAGTWESASIDTWTMLDVEFVGTAAGEFTVEGDIGKMDWKNVKGATGPITVSTTSQRTTTWGSDEVWCPRSVSISCTHTEDIGNVKTQLFNNVELPTGSTISIQGYVDTIDATSLTFNGAAGTDSWNIRDDISTGDAKGFRVNKADFKSSTIGTDIHFSVHEFISNNSTFGGKVQSSSDTVSISNSEFKEYVRHEVIKSMNIQSATYQTNAYYDHKKGASYPTAVLEDLKINGFFVASATNTGEDNTIALNKITCNHNINSNGAPMAGWERNVGEAAKKFLLRHMSNSVKVTGTKGCTLAFKNNIDYEVGKLFFDDREKANFVYDLSDKENNYLNVAVFDNAAYHVTSNIHIGTEGSDKTPSYGFVKFSKIDVDDQIADATNNDVAGKQNVNRHRPEVDLLGRSGYGDNYPVNLRINKAHIEVLELTGEDTTFVYPAGVDTAHCLSAGNWEIQDLSNLKDFTNRKDQAADPSVKFFYHVDDVNMTMDSAEVANLKVKADSLVFSGSSLVFDTTADIELAHSSAVRLNDAEFLCKLTLVCKESLDAVVRRTFFDRNAAIEAGWESNLNFRSVHILNSVDMDETYLPANPVEISVAGGSITLDHVKVFNGDLNVKSESGDIFVTQAFAHDTLTKVALVNYNGELDVTHPDMFYRDLTSLVSFEYMSGAPEGYEHAKIDFFAFEIGDTSSALTSVTDNSMPFVKYPNVSICTKFGKLVWNYAKNLTISQVFTLDSTATLEFKGYENVAGVSSIYAAGMDSFLGFPIDSLDMSKMYYVSVRDRSGADEDLTGKGVKDYVPSQTGATCNHEGTGHELFDICIAFVILPTNDLSQTQYTDGKAQWKGPTLKLGTVTTYMKDLASSAIESIEISDAQEVVLGNVIAKTVKIDMKHQDRVYYENTRGWMALILSTMATKKLTVNVSDSDKHISTYSHISFMEAKPLGLVPNKVTLTSVSGVQFSDDSAVRTVFPNNPNGESLLSCSPGTLNKQNSYHSCSLGGSTGSTVNFTGEENADLSEIKYGGTEDNKSKVYVTYAKMSSLTELGGNLKDVNSIDIKAGDNIVIDNHRFATDLADNFNVAYASMPDRTTTPVPTTNNIYVIPTTNTKAFLFVTVDQNTNDMFYFHRDFAGTPTTHKFNLIEQAQLFLYVPALDGLSITSASYNVNYILSNIGTYNRIFNTSYLIANVLRANTVHTTAAHVYSLEGSGVFYTEIGYVGVDVEKTSAKVSVSVAKNNPTGFGDSPAKQLPIVMLEKGTVKDLGIYTRDYKNLLDCSGLSSGKDCKVVAVPCMEESCDTSEFIWSPTEKLFWVGKNYSKDISEKNSLSLIYELGGVGSIKYRCPGVDAKGNPYNAVNCPNSPIYSKTLDYMSGISIRGQPHIVTNFNKPIKNSNRTTTIQTNTERVVVLAEMPSWAIGLIVVTSVIGAVLIAMFVLRLLGKESINDFRAQGVDVLRPN